MKLRNKKTGEIGKLICNPSIYNMYFVANDNGNASYNSIAELNEEWEDYDPEVSLIESEEIRKIIRAWAKINDVKKLKYNVDENSLEDIFRNTITFNHVLDLRDGHSYDINELCGEEEDEA